MEMLEMDEIEGIVVCTPTAVHAPPTIAALKAGKHVLCEKPMEASLDAASRMVRAAHETGKIRDGSLRRDMDGIFVS